MHTENNPTNLRQEEGLDEISSFMYLIILNYEELTVVFRVNHPDNVLEITYFQFVKSLLLNVS